MRRIEVSASVPADAIASSAGATASGLVSATVRAAWAWTTMPVMWWATRSCSPGQLQALRPPYRVDGLRAALLLETQVAADAGGRRPAREQQERERQPRALVVAPARLGHQHEQRRARQPGRPAHRLDVPQHPDGQDEQRARLRHARRGVGAGRAGQQRGAERQGQHDGEALHPVPAAQRHGRDAGHAAGQHQPLDAADDPGQHEVEQQEHAQPAVHRDLAQPA
ncbi:hypothetical protein ACFQQB_17485 [Nonomuraea rubra]|uniref:hypothetical protein n=1 Tax=Nonomuraea rubra TaxID=46180 RepID=UPI00360F4682